MLELPKKYNHQETEKRWQTEWDETQVYAWDESQPRDNTFVIDTPPPTVSGVLHMGHIYSYTQADFIARYQRMKGKTVFYPMGFDDNGLPTERLVEKIKKIRPSDMSREDFIAECESVSEEARGEFRRLFKSVALSVDWNQEYHTVSAESRKISQLSFLDLFNKDRAYRKLQPMLWDPVDQTAIAQAEVEDKEVKSKFSDITFAIDGSDKTITIGTTRPELIPACVAIFYHPDDERYKHLEGKQAITPLFGVKVPVLTDDTVEMDKGTGIMMCCTFGDEKDIEKWRKHDLPMRLILNKYGKIDVIVTDTCNPKHTKDIIHFHEMSMGTSSKLTSTQQQCYLDKENCVDISRCVENFETLIKLKARTSGREKILSMLDEAGALVKSEDITHAEPCAERSGAPLEILPTTQWFIKVIDQKEQLKAKAAECEWNPEWMKLRIDQWIDGLNWDWCISRQRYFGVPFPVWYAQELVPGFRELPPEFMGSAIRGKEKIIIASADTLPINPLASLPANIRLENKLDDGSSIVFTQDNIYGPNNELLFKSGTFLIIRPEADVMDTWATSSVSPQLSSKGITSELAVDAERHKKLFPADMRPQAHEIIRTWAFYTIVKAHLHEDVIPWKTLMISGWCLASDKTKMSKSKGNVVTPVDLIEEKGTDTVRYWTSTSKLGADTAFSEDALKIGKKLVNKLWNATKFAAIQLNNLDGKPTTAKGDIESGKINHPVDKWILTRLARAIDKTGENFDSYEYSNARAAVEDFFWNDLCDNYLEIAKARAYDEEGKDPAGQQSACYAIYHCLETVLRLFAPFVPHITEELYSHIFDDKFAEIGSIHARGTWPQSDNFLIDEDAEQCGIATVEILNVVRKIKAEANVSIKWPIDELLISAGTDGTKAAIEAAFSDLANVTSARSIAWTETSAELDTDSKKFKVIIRLAAEKDAA